MATTATLRARDLRVYEGVMEKQGGGTSFLGSRGWKRRYVVIKDRKWSVFEADPIGGKGKPLSKKGYDDMPCRDFEASSDELTVLLHPRDGGKDFKFRVGAGEGASVASEWVRAFRLNGATAPGAPAPEPEPEPEPAATEEPAAAAAAAATATEEPAAVTEEPVAAAATEEPAAATEEPAAATEEPAAATEEPAAATEEPAAATEEPAAVTEEPVAAAATEEPAAATEEPAAAAATEEPAMDAATEESAADAAEATG